MSRFSPYKIVFLLASGLLLFGLMQAYLFFSYWGLGIGVLLVFLVFFCLVLLAGVSLLFARRSRILAYARRLFLRIAGTKIWRRINAWMALRMPRVHRWLQRAVNLATARGVARAIGFSVAGLFLFFFLVTVVDIVFGIDIVRADVRIIYFFRTVMSPEASTFFVFFTHLADTDTVLAVFGIISLYLLALGRFRWIAYFAFVLASGAAVNTFIKWIILRPRPIETNLVALPADPSFPSAHAAMAVCLYGFIALLIFYSTRKTIVRIVTILSVVLIVILIGISRVYLGVHYLSDVLGGWYLGVSILAIVATLFEVERRFHFPGLVSIPDSAYGRRFHLSYAVIAAVGIGFVLANLYRSTIMLPAALPEHHIASIQTFFEHAPKFSENLVGRRNAPVSFIVIGSRDQLVNAFRAAGWNAADPPSFTNFLRLYSDIARNDDYPTAPVTPAFYNTRTNDLGFQKSNGLQSSRQRHHTRYWDTGYRLNGVPIWVATASTDIGVHIGSDIKLPTHKIDPNIDSERDYIANDLLATGAVGAWHRVALVGRYTGTNAAGDPFETDGDAYILWLR